MLCDNVKCREVNMDALDWGPSREACVKKEEHHTTEQPLGSFPKESACWNIEVSNATHA